MRQALGSAVELMLARVRVRALVEAPVGVTLILLGMLVELLPPVLGRKWRAEFRW